MQLEQADINTPVAPTGGNPGKALVVSAKESQEWCLPHVMFGGHRCICVGTCAIISHVLLVRNYSARSLGRFLDRCFLLAMYLTLQELQLNQQIVVRRCGNWVLQHTEINQISSLDAEFDLSIMLAAVVTACASRIIIRNARLNRCCPRTK